MMVSCKTGTSIFSSSSPYEQYAKKLQQAELHTTTLGQKWFEAGSRSLSNPVSISLPFAEQGFFAPDKPMATGYKFSVPRGQKLSISFNTIPDTSSSLLFAELYNASNNKRISFLDTSMQINYTAKETIELILLVQPQLLQPVSYTLSFRVDPSLAFPVSGLSSTAIASVWGDDRDGGARRHEGIDIFAKKRTPVLAVDEGTVTRVNENNLGGKVVWFRPESFNINVYYAHLDSQLVEPGQRLKAGDTVGLVGNTGNARTTPPHLHFGIYASGGAIDPYHFINTRVADPDKPETVDFPLAIHRASAEIKNSFKKDEPVEIWGVSKNQYRVEDINGLQYLLNRNQLREAKPQRQVAVQTDTKIYYHPDISSPVVTVVKENASLAVIASSQEFLFVKDGEIEGWIAK
jgi:murein DD-endopeptidase MepM/ murein hydrolase activator NlpD